MEHAIYIVDAFTNEAFKGNPAAVCPLDTPQPAEWMQQVAAEVNYHRQRRWLEVSCT